jgi:hypothetical protein
MKKLIWGVIHSANNKIAALFGITGGMFQFRLNIKVPVDFWSKLGEAGITAAFCGFLGVLGKELYKVLRNSVVAYFRSFKKEKRVMPFLSPSIIRSMYIIHIYRSNADVEEKQSEDSFDEVTKEAHKYFQNPYVYKVKVWKDKVGRPNDPNDPRLVLHLV